MWSPTQIDEKPPASAATAISRSSRHRTSRSTSGSCTPTSTPATTTAGPRPASVDDVREQTDLLELRRRRDEDQLVASGRLERGDGLPHRLLADRGARRDLVRERTEPGVVVLEVRVRVLARTPAEREVRKRQLPRFPGAARLLPGALERRHERGELVGRAAYHDPPLAEPRGASKGGLAVTADDQLGPSLARRLGADRPGVPALLAAPDALQLLELLVEAAAAGFRAEPGGLVVVVARAEPDAEHEPSRGEP